MKSRVQAVIRNVLVLAVCVSLYITLQIAAAALPDGTLYRLQSGETGVPAEKLPLWEKELDGAVSASVTEKTKTQGESAADVRVFSVFGDAADFAGGDLLCGTWEITGTQAVISETLAVRLFKSTNCLGDVLSLQNGEGFRVAGVYRKRGGFWRALAEDGTEPIFTLLDRFPSEGSADFIFLKGETREREETAALLDALSGGRLSASYLAENYTDAARVLRQIPYFAVLFLCIYLIFAGIWRIGKQTVGEKGSTPLWKEADRKRLGFAVAEILLCACVVVFAISRLRFDLFVPADLFREPADLFHLSAYGEAVVRFFRNAHRDAAYLWPSGLVFVAQLAETILLLPTALSALRILLCARK